MPSNPSLGKILIVESDTTIAELLQINLGSLGYEVQCIKTAQEVDRSNLGTTALVIVDSMNEPYTGLDLVYDLKDDPATEHIGIILCTSYCGDRMVIDALDAGADDYIVKPFSLSIMIARVRSILRRRRAAQKPASAPVTEFLNMTVDLQSKTVKIDGNPVPLSRTEFAILEVLLKNINNYVSRGAILQIVWADNSAGTNERIVDTNISRLRKKLGTLGDHITNRSGLGYMIN